MGPRQRVGAGLAARASRGALFAGLAAGERIQIGANGLSWRSSILPSRTSSSEAENEEARALRRIFGSTQASMRNSSKAVQSDARRSAAPARRRASASDQTSRVLKRTRARACFCAWRA